MTKFNLIRSLESDLFGFTEAVTNLAIHDHKNKLKSRSGKEILDIYANEYRMGHRRFATGIYNNVRWSLELAEEEKSNG